MQKRLIIQTIFCKKRRIILRSLLIVATPYHLIHQNAHLATNNVLCRHRRNSPGAPLERHAHIWNMSFTYIHLLLNITYVHTACLSLTIWAPLEHCVHTWNMSFTYLLLYIYEICLVHIYCSRAMHIYQIWGGYDWWAPENLRSLLQNMVSFIGFFCKRDLQFPGTY